MNEKKSKLSHIYEGYPYEPMTSEQANLIAMARALQRQLDGVVAFCESGDYRDMSPGDRAKWHLQRTSFHFTAGDFGITCLNPWKYDLPEARN
jgi:hypothetical protein